MKTFNKQKSAFTMLELVMVIVLLGILASIAIPRMDRDLRQEAADNILSAIRHTQHMALVDNKTDPFDVNWQQKLWMIRFTGGSDAFYTVSSDADDMGSVNKVECAVDPANGKYMFNASGAPSSMDPDESPNIFLGHKYGINAVSATGGCTVQHIAFDNLGRPFVGLKTTSSGTLGTNDYSDYMDNGDCNMTFSFADASVTPISIIIAQETGYAYIDGQDDS